MRNDEVKLLADALLFEQGHLRRTQHILKVYALVKLLGEAQRLTKEQQLIVQAAAILHDIAIRPCKELYGEATQENQKKETPVWVTQFLQAASYDAKYLHPVLDLVLQHHTYQGIQDITLQVLVEADLLVNIWESADPKQKKAEFTQYFVTATGKAILSQI